MGCQRIEGEDSGTKDEKTQKIGKKQIGQNQEREQRAQKVQTKKTNYPETVYNCLRKDDK